MAVVWVGRRSYGVYLYGLTLTFLLTRFAPGPPILISMLALSLATAAVSYRYLELPFLRLKDRLLEAPQGAIAPAAA